MLKNSSLRYAVQKVENDSQTRDIIPLKSIGFYTYINETIYLSGQKIMPTIEAIADVLFEIFCTQNYVSTFEKEHNSAITHPPEKIKKSANFT